MEILNLSIKNNFHTRSITNMKSQCPHHGIKWHGKYIVISSKISMLEIPKRDIK